MARPLCGKPSMSNRWSRVSLDELKAQEARLSSHKLIQAALVGFVVGIAIYAAANGRFFLTVILLLAAMALGRAFSSRLKAIQAEISRRAQEGS